MSGGERPGLLVHASAIALPNGAALIRGASGRGKSSLALRCLLHPTSALLPDAALLVSDDQVAVERRGDALFLRAPESIKGKIEVRGLGVIEVPCLAGDSPLALAVDLAPSAEIERLPDPFRETAIDGLRIPLFKVDPADPAAAAKLLLALRLIRPPPTNSP